MTINTECVVNHLKHDYPKIFKTVGWISAILLGFAILGYIILNGWNILQNLNLPSPQIWYYILIAITVSIIVFFTVIIGVFGNKGWFEYKPWKDGLGWANGITEGCGAFITNALIIGFIPHTLYWIVYLSIPNYESPLFLTIFFIVSILIGTPIGCAIARCRDE